jgi:hypothetical protein
MEETPPTEFDATTTQHEEIVVSVEKALLNPQHFLDDHLQLIFEMHRNMEDQLHNHIILSCRMDLLFNFLSGAPAQKHYLTCNQLFFFTYNNDGFRVLHTFSFSIIFFYKNQLQSIFFFVKNLVPCYSHVYIFCRPLVLVFMHVEE